MTSEQFSKRVWQCIIALDKRGASAADILSAFFMDGIKEGHRQALESLDKALARPFALEPEKPQKSILQLAKELGDMSCQATSV